MLSKVRRAPLSVGALLKTEDGGEGIQREQHLWFFKGTTLKNRKMWFHDCRGGSGQVYGEVFNIPTTTFAFNVSSTMMPPSDESFMQPVLMLCITARDDLTLANRRRPSRLVKVASKISGKSEVILSFSFLSAGCEEKKRSGLHCYFSVKQLLISHLCTLHCSLTAG